MKTCNIAPSEKKKKGRIVATPELLLALNAGWFALKPYIYIPDYISTLFPPHYIMII